MAATERDGRINENSRRFCGNSAQDLRLHSPPVIRAVSSDVSPLPFLFRLSAQPPRPLLALSHQGSTTLHFLFENRINLILRYAAPWSLFR